MQLAQVAGKQALTWGCGHDRIRGDRAAPGLVAVTGGGRSPGAGPSSRARGDGELPGDGGALAGRGPDLEPAATRGEPVGHVSQPGRIDVWPTS
jgi:hypothetical protein